MRAWATGFAVTDPDNLTLRDLIDHAGSTEDWRARLASPLADAEWEVSQYGSYAQELAAEANRLRSPAGEVSSDPDRGHKAGARDGIGGLIQERWATSRLDVVEDLQRLAEVGRDEAAVRVERLRGTGENVPDRGPESQWAKQWDTPERRAALRSHLARANVPPDAAQARLLADRAQGLPPEAATWHAPKGKPHQATPLRQAKRAPQLRR